MLATPGTRADVVGSGQEWVVEMKWDGIRAIVSVADGAVRVTSRSGRGGRGVPVRLLLSDLLAAQGRSWLAVPDDDGELRYAGRVGSGFSDRALAELERRLAPLARSSPPLADVPARDARDDRWVAPRHVGEVAHAGWTADGRLRHARWRGWREDKSPREVRREG